MAEDDVVVRFPDDRHVEHGLPLIPAVRPDEWHPTSFTVERVARWGTTVAFLVVLALIVAIIASL